MVATNTSNRMDESEWCPDPATLAPINIGRLGQSSNIFCATNLCS